MSQKDSLLAMGGNWDKPFYWVMEFLTFYHFANKRLGKPSNWPRNYQIGEREREKLFS